MPRHTTNLKRITQSGSDRAPELTRGNPEPTGGLEPPPHGSHKDELSFYLTEGSLSEPEPKPERPPISPILSRSCYFA